MGQITQLSGVSDSVVQTGINDLNVDGVTSTGNYGFNITAAATGSDITGSAFSDTIVLGAKSDIVTLSAYDASYVDTITGFTNTGSGVIDKIDIGTLTSATALET